MFIVIEGIDGTGKATQTALLVEHLRAENIPFETISFPQYGAKSAGPVEEYLNGKYGSAKEVGPYKASIFFAIDRFDAAPHIAQWIAEGKVVIANRYVGSNLGHQGSSISNSSARAQFFEWDLNLEYRVFGIPKPDYNIILDVPPEQAQMLVDKKQAREYLHGKKRDILENDLDHLKNASSVFHELAERMPNTYVVQCIEHNTLLSPQAIHAKIWQLVYPLVPHP